LAGLDEIPALICSYEESEALKVALLENIQRAQILGEIKTFEEAKSLAAKILKSQE
ncbi:MAG: hypothetical protein HOK41_17530, partial [Nitrospina sp.]|nr:hypothetical protein [Nitrospina sp.]